MGQRGKGQGQGGDEGWVRDVKEKGERGGGRESGNGKRRAGGVKKEGERKNTRAEGGEAGGRKKLGKTQRKLYFN